MEARHLSPKFEEAFRLAFDLHQTKGKQGRKGKDTPYVSHLMAVSSLVLEYGGSEEEAIAALLHDVVEDQGGSDTLRLIEQRFGPKVAKIVGDCSDCDGEPKPPWLERKAKYIAHIPHVAPSSRIVSLADKIHNAGTILGMFASMESKRSSVSMESAMVRCGITTRLQGYSWHRGLTRWRRN